MFLIGGGITSWSHVAAKNSGMGSETGNLFVGQNSMLELKSAAYVYTLSFPPFFAWVLDEGEVDVPRSAVRWVCHKEKKRR